MRGVTVFARLEPAPGLVGRPLRDVASSSSTAPLACAAAQAAQAIVDHLSGAASARPLSTSPSRAALSARVKEEAA